MNSSNAFDLHAAAYADRWESDPSARRMRRAVHRLVAQEVPRGVTVLDVGCGTGVDARWLLKRGNPVVGVDASAGMLARARRRAPGAELHQLSAERLDELIERWEGRLDCEAALLNFGVVNCVDLRRVARGLARCLPVGAPVIVVSMPRWSPAWTLGALRRGRLRAAVKRLKRRGSVEVAGQEVPVSYLGPRELEEGFRPWFSLEDSHALGLLLPPPGSGRSSALAPLLDRVETPLRRLPLLREMGDHVAVVLRRRARPQPRSRLSRLRARAEVARARKRGELRLQLLTLELTAGCQSRCVACDHRGPAGGEALTVSAAARLAKEARKLGATGLLLTGGEPLLRRDLDELLPAVAEPGLRLVLLSNGLALARRAELVARWCDELILSLDGHDRQSYQATRGVDGLAKLAAGVAALRALRPRMQIQARVTVTAHNAGHLRAIARRAAALDLDGVSFLAADTASDDALGRSEPAELPLPDLDVLRAELLALQEGPERRLVVDSDEALERILHKYEADAGLRAQHPPRCDAPWTSAVVTSELKLRPCFFHPPHGQLSEKGGLEAALEAAAPVLRDLDVATDPTCARCVCWARLA